MEIATAALKSKFKRMIPFKRQIKLLLNWITGKPKVEIEEFRKRILHRNKVFWTPPNAKIIRSKTMSAMDDFVEWKNGKYWQRKVDNKYNSREFAKKHRCKVPDLYWKGRNCSLIDFDRLPKNYVIKPTIGKGCRNVFVMHGSINLMDGKTYTKQDLIENMQTVLQKDEDVEILIEEFVRSEKGEYKLPDEYKFFTFNGEIACIMVINRLSPKSGFGSVFDENWNLMQDVVTCYSPAASKQSPPICLQEMISCAKRLSKEYEIFVRADFYATDKGAVFGEFESTPMGKYYTPFGYKLLTDYWDSFCKKMI